jgi:outer membrane protein OmpA-like peptidoglycan-associated protein
MKTPMLFTLLLAAALRLPAMVQQVPGDNQTAATTQGSSQSTSTQNVNSDQNLAAHQSLEIERQGFWGKINPVARKKYVQRQLRPIRNRVNELDDLTAANAKAIKDVDARSQEGIRQASAKADQADRDAIEAGNRAQQANQTALQASNRLHTVEQVVGSIDQYHLAAQIEIRFRPGRTAVSARAKQALDVMTADLKDQKGYIIEIQGFSASGGQAGIESSQAIANSVVRYLVEKNNIPVYHIFTMGLGNAQLPETENSNDQPGYGNRVDVSLLKNKVDQLTNREPAAL